MKRFSLGRAFDALCGLAAWIAGAAILLLMLMAVADVTSRKVRGESISGVLEYTEVILVAAVYLGIAHAERTGMNVKTSVLTSRLSLSVARWVRVVAGAVCLAAVTYLIYATGVRALESYEEDEYRFGLVEVSIWPVRFLLVFGLILYVGQLLRSFVAEIRMTSPAEPTVDAVEAGI